MRRNSFGLAVLSSLLLSTLALAQTQKPAAPPGDAAPDQRKPEAATGASPEEKATAELEGPNELSSEQTSGAASEQQRAAGDTAAARPGGGTAAPAKIREHFAPVNAQPGGLTARKAAESAAKVSPEAQVAQAKVASANASVDQVTWQYVPRLTLVASYTHLSPQPSAQNAFGGSLVIVEQTPAGGVAPIDPNAQQFAVDATQAFKQIQDQWYLSAGLIVPLSDYILNVKQALGGAKSAQDAALLTEKAERVTAGANAQIAYYDWVGAKLAARETDKSVERAGKQHETLKAQYQAGRASRADVLRADAFLSRSELDQVRARTQESITRERLHVMMTGGEESNQPDFAIGEDILDTPPARAEDQKSIGELQHEAIAYRLELRALRKTQEALEQKSKVERSQAYPRVEGFANGTYANPNQRVVPQVADWKASWDIGIRAVWTVNEIGIKRAEVKKTQASVDELSAQRKNIEFALRTEVVGAYQIEREARLAVSTAARGLDAAEAAYQDRILLFDNGRATSLDLLEAESALVGARLDLVQTYVALKKARVRLDHALGRDARALYPEVSAKK